MKCARCGAELPSGARFCLNCGTPVQSAPFPSNSAPVRPQFIPAPTRRSAGPKIAVVLILAALAGLLAWSFGSKMLQQPGSTPNNQLVQAPSQSGTGTLVQAPAQSQPGQVVQAPSQSQPQMDTTAISDYLKFLQQVELTKQTLIGKELGSALNTYGNITPNEVKAAASSSEAKTFLPKVNADSGRLKDEWDQLIQVFTSRQAPPACQQLQQKYYESLAKIEAEFVQVHDALADAQTNPTQALNSLSGMMGTASADADSSTSAADNALADVCTKYGLDKNFSITTGSSTSSLLH